MVLIVYLIVVLIVVLLVVVLVVLFVVLIVILIGYLVLVLIVVVFMNVLLYLHLIHDIFLLFDNSWPLRFLFDNRFVITDDGLPPKWLPFRIFQFRFPYIPIISTAICLWFQLVVVVVLVFGFVLLGSWMVVVVSWIFVVVIHVVIIVRLLHIFLDDWNRLLIIGPAYTLILIQCKHNPMLPSLSIVPIALLHKLIHIFLYL